jgi:hypothetical protein
MSKFSVEWATPTCKRSTCADPIDYWYLNAKVRRAGKRKFEAVCSSQYGQGYYTREDVGTDAAKAAFLEKLKPKPRSKKSGSPATSTPVAIKVETSTGRVGALGIDSLGGAKREINRELEATGACNPPPLKRRPAGPEEAAGGKHRTAAEKEANQEDAEARKLRKEQLQDLMFTGHAGDLLETDEGGRDRHLDDLSPADARDMVLRAAAPVPSVTQRSLARALSTSSHS